jgi:hypothetical protein
MKKILAVLIISLMVGACGGGGSNSNTESGTAEGLWQGTTSTNRAIAGVVLDDGTFWFIYSGVGNSSVIAGVVQGNGTSNNGSFTSSNGRDFSFEGLGVNDFTLAATYAAKNTLRGTVTSTTSGSGTFASTYSTDYELTPNLLDIAGTYSGSDASSGGVESATVAISSTGVISGNSAKGCSFTGNATPRPNGNVYNVSVTFGGGVCVNGTNTVTGVAYFDASTRRLTSAALNSGRTDGFLYVGTKP